MGLLISLPILILIVYFLFSGSLNKEYLESSFLLDYTLNTSYLIVGTAIFVVIIGVITSYLSARFEYFGSKFFSICFVLPLAYPAYIFGYTYVGFFEFRGLLSQFFDDTSIKLDILNMPGAIFIFTIAMFPYVFILARVSFSMISKTIVELISLQKLNPVNAFLKFIFLCHTLLFLREQF